MPLPQINNLTSIGNSSGVVEMLQNTNATLFSSYLGILILLAVFMITTFSFLAKTNDTFKSILGSMFICFILSILLRIMELVPDEIVIGTLTLTAIFLGAAYMSD